MPSVLQKWVEDLPLKLQTTLLSAIRGCDGVARNDIIKTMARGIRKMTLVPSRPRVIEPGGFMSFEMMDLKQNISDVCEDLAKYPTHYIHHLILACEVLGYFHPATEVRDGFLLAYMSMVRELNLYPETREQCIARGNAK